MSQANIELHRRLYAAFNANDIDGLIALFDPQVEFHSRFVVVGGVTVFRGHDGLRSWHRGFEEVWGYARHMDLEAFFDLGEQTLALTVFNARGLQSGAETTMRLAQVVRWRSGLCAYLTSYSGLKEALGELGVSEDDLERVDP